MLLFQLASHLLPVVLLTSPALCAEATKPADARGHVIHKGPVITSGSEEPFPYTYKFRNMQQLILPCDGIGKCDAPISDIIAPFERELFLNVDVELRRLLNDLLFDGYTMYGEVFSCFDQSPVAGSSPDKHMSDRSFVDAGSAKRGLGELGEVLACANELFTMDLHFQKDPSPDKIEDLRDILEQVVDHATTTTLDDNPSLRIPFSFFGNFLYLGFELSIEAPSEKTRDGTPVLDLFRREISDFLHREVLAASHGSSHVETQGEIKCNNYGRECDGLVAVKLWIFMDASTAGIIDGLYRTVAMFGSDNSIFIEWRGPPYDLDPADNPSDDDADGDLEM
mmetsp:Transcript_24251/g.67564  ORF Transcript_24251/g.67564 Transcript_24251/m.67564 type:complete len:338 (+) Transcript_24251:300-1313(+)